LKERKTAGRKTKLLLLLQAFFNPATAEAIGPIEYPGMQIQGRSVMDPNDPYKLRVPTIYAPFRSGVIFVLGQRPPGVAKASPGVALRLSNVTLMMENVTWSGLISGTSGLESVFRLQDNARVCFTNRCSCLPS
jgi:hypothetical protein